MYSHTRAALAASVAGAVLASAAPAAADATADEAALVSRINSLRSASGVPALRVDPRLSDVARAWAARLAAAGSLQHNPALTEQAPDGWRRIGENVAVGEDASSISDSLAASPDHRRRMLDAGFTSVGAGVAYGGGRMWAVQVFMAAPAPEPVGSRFAGSHWYRLANSGGQVYTFGATGGVASPAPPAAVVATARTPSGQGMWSVAANGTVTGTGDARVFGSMEGRQLNAPIVGMATTPTGNGYWLLGRDGGVFSFGDARFFGSTGAIRLNRPVVGMTATPTGNGYWFVAADGGVFAFGDARFFGSTGAIRLNRPVVGMSRTPTGRGYWLVASDGGVFSFGDAPFLGSTGAIRLRQPIVGMSPTASGRGYRFVASDGGVFNFGDAPYIGSLSASAPATLPVVSMVSGS